MKTCALNFGLDFETANPSRASICAAGLAVFVDGKLTEAPYWLVRPPKGHGMFHLNYLGHDFAGHPLNAQTDFDQANP